MHGLESSKITLAKLKCSAIGHFQHWTSWVPAVLRFLMNRSPPETLLVVTLASQCWYPEWQSNSLLAVRKFNYLLCGICKTTCIKRPPPIHKIWCQFISCLYRMPYCVVVPMSILFKHNSKAISRQDLPLLWNVFRFSSFSVTVDTKWINCYV